jgi:biotin transport system substrate-specific component
MAETTLARAQTLTDLSFSRPWQNAAAVVLGTAFVAACAHLTVPLFFTPVPLSMQPFAVILLGLLYAPSLGFATLALYLVEGAAGLPVFTPNGPGGVAQLLGPTGGYLLSYPFVAYLGGWLRRSFPITFTGAALSAGLASLLILACGATGISLYHHAGIRTTLTLAVLPFLPGDALKVVMAAGIVTGIQKFRSQRAANR